MKSVFSNIQFDPVDSKLLFSRGDSADPRLGERVQILPAVTSAAGLGATAEEAVQTHASEGRQYFLAGYPDDEGIRINGGRAGAGRAPTEVRRSLYKMTPGLFSSHSARIWDVGDLHAAGHDLAKRHEIVSNAAHAVLEGGGYWIGIGGGHDFGFPDADAFCRWCLKSGSRPLVINFDAHLDVRPTDRGLSSGTPFFRMLEAHPEVDFAEIGIQAHCNSLAHLNWAKAKGARILSQEEMEVSGQPMTTKVLELLGDWLIRPRPAFLSVDIDAFSSAVAPGCSQSWATGLMPADFFATLSVLCARLDVRSLGIYEVSPELDHDNRTAKLAAQIIHRVVSA